MKFAIKVFSKENIIEEDVWFSNTKESIFAWAEIYKRKMTNYGFEEVTYEINEYLDEKNY